MRTYYNQIDKREVEEIKKDLVNNGFDVSISLATCQIKRETSKYDKYMKWHMLTISANNAMASEYFKSQPEALRYLNKPRRPMPIGTRMSLTYITLI